MLSSMNLSKIPKFYFPANYVGSDVLQQENNFINGVFSNNNDIDINKFLTITTSFYNFPKTFNKVLFNKIDVKGTGKISKTQFIEYHAKEFRGISKTKRYFNFIKQPKNNVILPEDFKPFLDCLLESNESLAFLKEYPIYQKKYSDTVVQRIFYTNDKNDDGKITLRDFNKSNLIEVLNKVSESDINTERKYFSYEHFYVVYCIFYELDTTKEPEKESFISKESFSKYDSHSLCDKAVNKIFEEVPRKFRSPIKGRMSFHDFLWYILSEEDKTSDTSIKYWFRILDLDGNGIVTPSEMEYFYEEQEKRLESYQNEIIKFNDVLCQLHDMIPPKKEYQWTLEDFLSKPECTSIIFNALFNLRKFIDNEQKDPFSKNEIDKDPEYSDWDRYAYYEYANKMRDEESNEGEGAELNESNEENEEKV